MNFVLILTVAIAAGLAAALIVAFTRGGSPATPPKPQPGTRPMTTQEKTQRMAQGIAKAEGFFKAGSLPQRANNPGAMKSIGFDFEGETPDPNDDIGGKARFTTPEAGWKALYRQIDFMRTGQSKNFRPDWTFRQIAMKWTGNDNPEAWAQTVTREIGLSPESKLAEYFA